MGSLIVYPLPLLPPFIIARLRVAHPLSISSTLFLLLSIPAALPFIYLA